jgi:hypothetical protein
MVKKTKTASKATSVSVPAGGSPNAFASGTRKGKKGARLAFIASKRTIVSRIREY